MINFPELIIDFNNGLFSENLPLDLVVETQWLSHYTIGLIIIINWDYDYDSQYIEINILHILLYYYVTA